MQKKLLMAVVAVCLIAALFTGASWVWEKLRLRSVSQLGLPEGLVVEVLVAGLPEARQLALSADGSTLFVGSRRAGKVYRVRLDTSGSATSTETLIEGLQVPSGVALRSIQGREDLYISARSEVWIVKDAVNHSLSRRLTDKLPDSLRHDRRYLRFGPDGYLYVPVGAPCNVCLSDDPRYGTILRMDPDTGATEVFASGVRNSSGLVFHPETDALWFTDNGRDLLGDDIPAEEINIADKAGLHFGFPYIHQGDLPDPEFGKGADPAHYQPPHFRLQAHVAPLGIAFNNGRALGDEWQGALFVAEHGSWNRTSPVGYQVGALRAETDGTLTYKRFLWGFQSAEDLFGRPTDVVVTPEGHLLVSDDYRGRVLRVRRADPED